jgi:hypothetical protein
LVEWAYKINSVSDGRVSLWIDGVQRMSDELMPPDPNYMDIDTMIFSGFMSTLKNYAVGFYLDDIVVTNDYDTPIGPRGGTPPAPDTVPPSAPQGLRVR